VSESQEGLVELILPGGEGVLRHQNNNILIANTVAGDHIQYQIAEKRRGVLRGELRKVLKPSIDRIQAPCPVANECGGCALQHMSLSSQAALKTEWVHQAFVKCITHHTQFTALNSSQTVSAGRRRVRWFIEGGKMGFRKRISHQIVHNHKCMVVSPGLNERRKQLEHNLQSFPPVIESIQAVELSNGYHIIFESNAKFEDVVLPDVNVEENVQYWWRHLDSPSIKPLHRPTFSFFDSISLEPYKNCAVDIQIGPNDFIQGHQQGNQILIQQVLEWSKGSHRIVDLFSGCGNLSLPLAAAFNATVVGAESNVHSVHAANKNAKRLKLDATYHEVDLFGRFAIEPFIGADTLIIDPPRKGAKRICNMIQQFFPKQIIMVNCDAASGSRDALALQQAGFRLKALRPLDLFPYTGHVEVISLWTS